VRDLLHARDPCHLHLRDLDNVVGTFVGRELVRDNDREGPSRPEVRPVRPPGESSAWPPADSLSGRPPYLIRAGRLGARRQRRCGAHRRRDHACVVRDACLPPHVSRFLDERPDLFEEVHDVRETRMIIGRGAQIIAGLVEVRKRQRPSERVRNYCAVAIAVAEIMRCSLDRIAPGRICDAYFLWRGIGEFCDESGAATIECGRMLATLSASASDEAEFAPACAVVADRRSLKGDL
jgi:hypothetical protein